VSSQTAPVSLRDLQAPIHDKLDLVSQELHRIVKSDFPLITEVNAHLFQMRGKMLRPTLLLLAGQATGERDSRAPTLAAVVELIHLATLVHDDSVDHSVLRRGMPTINSLFSHQISVIMGDYLYSRAVIELVALNDLDPLRILGRVTNEMTVGEMRQLLSHEPLDFSEPEYDLLIRAKTASLLSGACEVGALLAEPSQRMALRRFGEFLGNGLPDRRRPAGLYRAGGSHREAAGRRSPGAQGDAAADPCAAPAHRWRPQAGQPADGRPGAG
jgi:octaprenyl-diphosphate synthase